MAKSFLTLARMLRIVSCIHATRNRVLNMLAQVLTGQPVLVDWRDLKIIHPEKIDIGAHFGCGRSVWLESVDGHGYIEIGEHVNFSDNVHVGAWCHIQICDGVLVGSRVLISDHSHGPTPRMPDFDVSLPPNKRPLFSKGPIVIGSRAWLGDGVCVLSGVSVGEGAIVGANSVVVCDVPAHTVWAGVPARQIWPRTLES
jgi:lipopolysaccharide O-acetyltransferase